VSFEGRVVLLAGATGAIGSATARLLARHGALLCLTGFPDSRFDALAEEMHSLGRHRVLLRPADITRAEQVFGLVAETCRHFGRLDVLVNAAGIGSPPALADCNADEIARVIAVNLTGPAYLMRAVLPVMREQGGGSIVNVGSIAGEVGVMGIYSASKFGLRGLTDSVRREARQWNVRVSLIQPGFVRSPMNPQMSNLPDPQIVAEAILAAVAHPRRSRIVPAAYWWAVRACSLLPGLTDLVFGDGRIQERLNRDSRVEAARRRGA
jgi:NAD(P)-dependent dehydrogenase (short-subunit alcohol dehydrogenase family)